MTTEDAATIESTFDLWRKCPNLSIDEAMNLIMGFLPSTYRFDYAKEQDMPDGSVPIYRKLVQDIKDFKLHIYIREIEISSEDTMLYINELFQENVISYDEYLHSCWWHDGKLRTVDVKKWLQQQGFSSTFFETKRGNIPDYLNNELEEHSYKLAAAIKAWEHFYTHGLTNPKKSLKENIEAWLTENAIQLNLLHNKKISTQAIQDVAKIVNWKTEGGAPKS